MWYVKYKYISYYICMKTLHFLLKYSRALHLPYVFYLRYVLYIFCAINICLFIIFIYIIVNKAIINSINIDTSSYILLVAITQSIRIFAFSEWNTPIEMEAALAWIFMLMK